MQSFKDWFLERKQEIHPVHPEIKQWAGSVEKLHKDLERLKKILKDKHIDLTVGKNGKPELKPIEKKKKEDEKKPETTKIKELKGKKDDKEEPKNISERPAVRQIDKDRNKKVDNVKDDARGNASDRPGIASRSERVDGRKPPK